MTSDARSRWTLVLLVALGTACNASVTRTSPESIPVEPLCSSDHWCWENPLPHGNPLNAMRASSATNVWLAGSHGTVQRFDAVAWHTHPLPPDADVVSIWTSASDDTWCVTRDRAGTQSLRHWDGVSWSIVVPTGDETFRALDVWGTARDNVWVVGTAPGILRFDGHSWSTPAAATLGTTQIEFDSVTGSDANNVWFARHTVPYALVCWNGGSFENASPPMTAEDGAPLAVWSNSPSDTWLFMPYHAYHRAGATWTPSIPAVGAAYSGLSAWGFDANDVWAAGARIAEIDTPLARWDGTAWTADVIPVSNVTLRAVGGSGRDDVWATGDRGTVLHRTSNTWSAITRDVSPNEPIEFTAVWGSSATDVWAIGTDPTSPMTHTHIWHSDGVTWTDTQTVDGRGMALWGTAPDDVWCVGWPGLILHWTGSQWSRVESGQSTAEILDVWGSAANDVWATLWSYPATASAILHWDGATWTRVLLTLPFPQSTMRFARIRGTAADDIWAVGDVPYPGTREGAIHFDGATWSATTFDGPGRWRHQQPRFALWPSARNDVWIAGAGSIWHWNGTEFNSTPMPGADGPFWDPSDTVAWGAAADDVWIAGGAGVMAHWDGATWSAIDSGSAQSFQGIWGTDTRTMWAVGRESMVMRRAVIDR